MIGGLEKQVLKGVSRSFYLTLRLLPGPMRGAASLAYLLARTSDTLADTAAAPVALRMECLRLFAAAVAGGRAAPRWPDSFLTTIEDPRERHLLELCGDLIHWLRALDRTEAALVREVVEIIISGQTLDLERFATASREQPVALPDDNVLEDYAWRVAGCVGAFWTKLGFLTLGGGFSTAGEDELLERGIAYGKGLQLVNILRDLPADLENGRCYLPVADPHNLPALLASHGRWLVRARAWAGEGETYAATLGSRRLRAATVLPALLARKTLGSLEGASWEDLQARLKIPRRAVYQALLQAFFMPPATRPPGRSDSSGHRRPN
ncbi:MAG: squalene/phytoene synthase family protein [Akkermansiaceae bacterium]